MEFNEIDIIARCKEGDWRDFDTIYDHYLPKIYRFIYYRTRHKQIAEDLTSTIFLKVVQNLNSFRHGAAPFSAWLYRVARNTLIDHARVAKPILDLETAVNVADKQNVSDETNEVLNLEAIKSQMTKLSDQQREIVTMRVWDGLSHKEISEILEISEGSSKVAFSRAVDKLRLGIEII
jgi:RNA polymerase sigma-70 factor (ECF subfamily)